MMRAGDIGGTGTARALLAPERRDGPVQVGRDTEAPLLGAADYRRRYTGASR